MKHFGNRFKSEKIGSDPNPHRRPPENAAWNSFVLIFKNKNCGLGRGRRGGRGGEREKKNDQIGCELRKIGNVATAHFCLLIRKKTILLCSSSSSSSSSFSESSTLR